jgi:hypothetical protein
MSYKYHERAMVLNERNLIRCWDVAFNGYNGGCDNQIVNWNNKDDLNEFGKCISNVNSPYCGKSIMVMRFKNDARHNQQCNPLIFHYSDSVSGVNADADNVHDFFDQKMNLFKEPGDNFERWKNYSDLMPNFCEANKMRQPAGYSAIEQQAEVPALAFQGSYNVNRGSSVERMNGTGHLGNSYVGVASVREGKGMFWNPGGNFMKIM